MDIKQTQSVMLKVADLRPNEGQIEGVPANPRYISEKEYQELKDSLQADNLTGVLQMKVFLHDGAWVVMDGNMRLKAVQELGIKEVQCLLIPDDTDAKTLRKIVISSNSTFGNWDMDMLANEWDAGELNDWGVDVLTWIGNTSDILDEANFESLQKAVGNRTGEQQVTFVFSKEESEVVSDWINEHSKKELQNKIVELCQEQEAK